MSEKNRNIVIVVVVILILLLAWYVSMGRRNNGADMNDMHGAAMQGMPEGGAAMRGAPAAEKKRSFAEFIKNPGGAYKCTVHQSVQGTESTGITYIDGKMMRGDYNIKMQGMDMTSSMIMRDGYSYSWSSMSPSMGFKMPVNDAVETDTTKTAHGSYEFDANQIGDYDCQPWSSDASMFELPKTVTFTEMKMK